MALTIPELFDAAVADVPDKEWLVHEDATFTYAQAHARIGRALAALAERGVGPGRPRARHRRQPPRLRTALAGGHVPRGDLRGRRPSQHRGRARGAGRPGGAEARGGRRERGRALRRRRAGAGRSRPREPRRSRRADPHVRDHRALEARHPDPPRLRDGRRGLPVVDGADGRRPADDLAAAVPHQRAGLLHARVGGRPGEPRAAAGLLGEHVHRVGPAIRRDGVQLDRRDARDPHAPARAARRRRQPAAPLLHRALADRGAPARDRGAVRAADRVRVRDVRDALRDWSGGAAPGRTGRWARCASTPRWGRSTRARVRRRRSCSCATRRSCRATGACPRRRAGCSCPTAGCGPATSFATTATGPTRSSAARRRSSGAAARTWRPPRSRRR